MNNTKSRICHLTIVHPRNDVRILFKECRSLASAGYEVHLVVGDGQGDAVFHTIRIHDIGMKPGSRIKRMRVQPKRAWKKIIELKPDIVHFHDPELLPVGIKLARCGLRVVYDVHEDVPRQTLTKHWIPSLLRVPVAKAIEVYENTSVNRLSGIVAATPYIESRFSGKGVPTININNYPIADEFVSGEARPTRLNKICYVGVISRMRGVVEVVRALPLVPGVRLTLCGEICEPGLETMLRQEPGWSQVDYLGFVDRATVKNVLEGSFAGLVTLLPAPNYIDSLPVKMFEYMSAELPVIASDFPLWREIIDGAGCGRCVNPASPEAIAEAIRNLLLHRPEAEEMGRAGRRAVLSKYNWKVEEQKLVEFYEGLA